MENSTSWMAMGFLLAHLAEEKEMESSLDLPLMSLFYVLESTHSFLLTTKIKNNRKEGSSRNNYSSLPPVLLLDIISSGVLWKDIQKNTLNLGLKGNKSLDERHTHPWPQRSRVSFVSTVTLSPVKRESI